MLAEDDFTGVPDATAATIAEFVRDADGEWEFRAGLTGFTDDDLATFPRVMGRARA